LDGLEDNGVADGGAENDAVEDGGVKDPAELPEREC
jgi:hypothetical protein